MEHPGPELALLLLASYRKLVDQAVLELEHLGYPDVTPTLHYAMTAISLGSDSATKLAEALTVTKQAAAKTVTALAARGWVEIAADPTDSRRKHLTVTELGRRVMSEGEATFDRLRSAWAEDAGDVAVTQLERTLRPYVGSDSAELDRPGWTHDV